MADYDVKLRINENINHFESVADDRYNTPIILLTTYYNYISKGLDELTHHYDIDFEINILISYMKCFNVFITDMTKLYSALDETISKENRKIKGNYLYIKGLYYFCTMNTQLTEKILIKSIALDNQNAMLLMGYSQANNIFTQISKKVDNTLTSNCNDILYIENTFEELDEKTLRPILKYIEPCNITLAYTVHALIYLHIATILCIYILKLKKKNINIFNQINIHTYLNKEKIYIGRFNYFIKIAVEKGDINANFYYGLYNDIEKLNYENYNNIIIKYDELKEKDEYRLFYLLEETYINREENYDTFPSNFLGIRTKGFAYDGLGNCENISTEDKIKYLNKAITLEYFEAYLSLAKITDNPVNIYIQVVELYMNKSKSLNEVASREEKLYRNILYITELTNINYLESICLKSMNLLNKYCINVDGKEENYYSYLYLHRILTLLLCCKRRKKPFIPEEIFKIYIYDIICSKK